MPNNQNFSLIWIKGLFCISWNVWLPLFSMNLAFTQHRPETFSITFNLIHAFLQYHWRALSLCSACILYLPIMQPFSFLPVSKPGFLVCIYVRKESTCLSPLSVLQYIQSSSMLAYELFFLFQTHFKSSPSYFAMSWKSCKVSVQCTLSLPIPYSSLTFSSTTGACGYTGACSVIP